MPAVAFVVLQDAPREGVEVLEIHLTVITIGVMAIPFVVPARAGHGLRYSEEMSGLPGIDPDGGLVTGVAASIYAGAAWAVLLPVWLTASGAVIEAVHGRPVSRGWTLASLLDPVGMARMIGFGAVLGLVGYGFAGLYLAYKQG